MQIEPERRTDAAAIRDVVLRAFAREPVVDELVALIRASPQYVPELALVARVDGMVAGFVMISRASVVDGADARREVLTLSPLAVAPEHERRGIGSALVRAGLAAAEHTGVPLVVLEGRPDYYGRLGFRSAREFGITIDLPDWAPPEAAQVYPLAAYDPTVRGRVVYPPAFAVLG